jgi:hypothetical protein
MHVTIYVDEKLTPQVKIGSSSRTVVPNQVQWFILVTFKDHTSKDVMHEFGD